MSQIEVFEKWWAGTYGQILELTGDEEADATCRIAKIAAMDAWKTALATPPATPDSPRPNVRGWTPMDPPGTRRVE